MSEYFTGKPAAIIDPDGDVGNGQVHVTVDLAGAFISWAAGERADTGAYELLGVFGPVGGGTVLIFSNDEARRLGRKLGVTDAVMDQALQEGIAYIKAQQAEEAEQPDFASLFPVN